MGGHACRRPSFLMGLALILCVCVCGADRRQEGVTGRSIRGAELHWKVFLSKIERMMRIFRQLDVLVVVLAPTETFFLHSKENYLKEGKTLKRKLEVIFLFS